MTISMKRNELATLDGGGMPWTQSERYYFAYGSNMNGQQLRARGVKPLSATVAKLLDYKIAFHGYEKKWDGALETVVAAPEHEVWGVMYKLTLSDGDILDSWQDVRLDGTGAYFLFPSAVIDREGAKHPVLLYKKDILGVPLMPSREYLDFIVQGALEHRLPEHYIGELRAIESKTAAFEVPVPDKSGSRFPLMSSCSECGD